MSDVLVAPSFEAWCAKAKPNSIHAVICDAFPPSCDNSESFATALKMVLVPGAHVFMRDEDADYAVAVGLADAGFEIRGAVQRVFHPITETEPYAVEGFRDVQDGLVNAHVSWTLARNPISETTVAKNLRKWKTGELRRISSQQPFFDVINADFGASFIRAIVRASLPLGVGTILQPFAKEPDVLEAANKHEYDAIALVPSVQAHQDLLRVQGKLRLRPRGML